MIEGIIVTTLVVAIVIHHIWKWILLQDNDIPVPHANDGSDHKLAKGNYNGTFVLQSETTYVVQIHGERYIITQPPQEGSLVVSREMKNLATNFDVEEAIRQIDIVAMSLKVVMYGVVNDRDLELEVVKLQAKVEEICNLSGNAVKQFEMKAVLIVTQMQNGIKGLMDGYGEEASEHFRKIEQTSNEMRKSAVSLKKALNDLKMDVNKVFLDVTKTTTARIEATNAKRKAMLSNATDIQDALFERKKQQAIADRLEAPEERDQLRKAEKTVTNELLEFTASLKNTDARNDPEDLIETTLRGAEKALKTLRSAISRIVEFWDDLDVQCESIIDAGSGCIGKMGREMDAEKRDEFFMSRTFQTGAVEYMARWVAMQMMCKAFTEALKPVMQALQCSLSDIPSKHLASTKMSELVLELETKLQARNKNLQAKDDANVQILKATRAE